MFYGQEIEIYVTFSETWIGTAGVGIDDAIFTPTTRHQLLSLFAIKVAKKCSR